jgi:2-C-methyl-D-erythritol 4-phosphate cytidylyltransferase
LRVIAILTAAGLGKRFSIKYRDNIPKQFISLLGKPVILYSLVALQECRLIDQIIVTANKNYFDRIHSLASKYKISKLYEIIEGGRYRAQSVKNAFDRISPSFRGFVLIHDAARPNISSQMIHDILKYAEENGNSVVGTKITDTIKRVKKRTILETVDRQELYLVQTPQVFKYQDLKHAYKKIKTGSNHTDESSMIESAGYKVKLFDGQIENIKLTTKDDVRLLKKVIT